MRTRVKQSDIEEDLADYLNIATLDYDGPSQTIELNDKAITRPSEAHSKEVRKVSSLSKIEKAFQRPSKLSKASKNRLRVKQKELEEDVKYVYTPKETKLESQPILPSTIETSEQSTLVQNSAVQSLEDILEKEKRLELVIPPINLERLQPSVVEIEPVQDRERLVEIEAPEVLAKPVGTIAIGPEYDIEPASQTSPEVLLAEVETEQKPDVKGPQTFSMKARTFMERHFYISQTPEIVLPSAPTDKEKLGYLYTARKSLLTTGIFAYLSASAGIWLFVICSPAFYWFGIVVTFIQTYLGIFYLTSALSKDFDNEHHEAVKKSHAITCVEDAPTVDIYLPCCKEPLVILENTYQHVIKMDYPEGRLQVHVLDDGNQEEVKHLAAKYGFNYIVREDRPRLKKAGNLRWAFARTEGEYFVIYDADFCPRADFLTELIPRMKEDHNIAILQTPQWFRSRDEQTWVERGAGPVQEIFYRFIQPNRDKWGGAICVGSNAVYRREALVETGGTAEVGASEDVHTGFFAVTRGWTVRFVPICMAGGICPDDTRAFFSQQVRWCQGSTSLLLNMEFWRSNLSWKQKTCYLSGMLYYSATVLQIAANPLPAIMLTFGKIEALQVWNLAFAVPGLLVGLVFFPIWSRGKYGIKCQHVGIIMAYAYLSALVDRVVGSSFTWVSSGEGVTAHKSNRYRNYRMLAIGWFTITYGAFIAGSVWRMTQGYSWHNFFPIFLLYAYTAYVQLPFLLAK